MPFFSSCSKVVHFPSLGLVDVAVHNNRKYFSTPLLFLWLAPIQRNGKISITNWKFTMERRLRKTSPSKMDAELVPKGKRSLGSTANPQVLVLRLPNPQSIYSSLMWNTFTNIVSEDKFLRALLSSLPHIWREKFCRQFNNAAIQLLRGYITLHSCHHYFHHHHSHNHHSHHHYSHHYHSHHYQSHRHHHVR